MSECACTLVHLGVFLTNREREEMSTEDAPKICCLLEVKMSN